MRARAVVLALLCASSALAARPRVSSIARATRPPPPASMPENVGASEHVDGIDVAQGRSYQQDLPSAQRDPGFLSLRAAGRRCLSTSASTGSASTLELPLAAVLPVRAERLVEREKRTSLEVLDLAVDTRTRGVRRLARHLVPLTPIGRAGKDLEVYAYAHGDALYVVARSVGTITSSGPSFTASGCGLVVAALRIHGETTSTLQLGAAITAKKPDQRHRFVFALISTSKTARDPEPVLSVALRREESPLPGGVTDIAEPMMR
ncbi:MAG: hypothetical protein KC776_07635 [Myxococcales bacterium]|nr:hypothetical protein [Myxococcales bacterium]